MEPDDCVFEFTLELSGHVIDLALQSQYFFVPILYLQSLVCLRFHHLQLSLSYHFSLYSYFFIKFRYLGIMLLLKLIVTGSHFPDYVLRVLFDILNLSKHILLALSDLVDHSL